ncbi:MULTISPECIES: competence protein CoiA [Bacillaceae]|uniref:Competence protein CoiA n=1 Tax=Evansella alkalicola TaxID=745819 RepID=A0ABS6JSR5_9BACI|nr:MULTISPECIES: competence protein CoiA family protein [Bacillaceae]MBU9721614.1 hypothetical protein [Bacillus alkalicola]
MYKAIFDDNIVNLLNDEYKDKREYLKANNDHFNCPICKEKVRLRWAEKAIRAPHFYHKSISECIYHDSESPEHRDGKINLFNYFLANLQHKTEIIDVEHYLPETNQIADIYIKFINGTQWVVEYQRSNIPSEVLIERRSKYKSLGIQDIWILGENVVTENGFLECSVLNIGQTLVSETSFGKGSLVTYNPLSNEVIVYRGL